MTDFSKLQFVSTANPRKSKYDIQMLKDDKFRVSSEAFARLNLAINGLTQVDSTDEVFLAIGESDKSVFYKNTAKGTRKTLIFKNSNLTIKLQELYNAVEHDMFSLVYESDYNGFGMYRISPVKEGTPVDNVPDADVTEEVSPIVTPEEEIPVEEEKAEEVPAQEEDQEVSVEPDDYEELY